MTERPILFSAPMVRALLDGSKTQTRRTIKAPASVVEFKHFDGRHWDRLEAGGVRGDSINCPYGQPGDRLWVREAWRTLPEWDGLRPSLLCGTELLRYEANGQCRNGYTFGASMGRYRPPMFMPRWASRITLEVTGVRIERLQGITETDAIAESLMVERQVWCDPDYPPADVAYRAPLGTNRHATSTAAYKELWEALNGPGSWAANPWVWVVEFKVVKP